MDLTIKSALIRHATIDDNARRSTDYGVKIHFGENVNQSKVNGHYLGKIYHFGGKVITFGG